MKIVTETQTAKYYLIIFYKFCDYLIILNMLKIKKKNFCGASATVQ